MKTFLTCHNKKKRLPVDILDIVNKNTTKYESISAASFALNTNEKNIRYADKHNKLLLKKYLVKVYRVIKKY